MRTPQHALALALLVVTSAAFVLSLIRGIPSAETHHYYAPAAQGDVLPPISVTPKPSTRPATQPHR